MTRAGFLTAAFALALIALDGPAGFAKDRSRRFNSENAMQQAVEDAAAAQERAEKAAEAAAQQAEAQQRAMEDAQRRALQAAEEAQRRLEAQQRAAEEAQRRAQQAADEAAKRAAAQQQAADEAQRRAQQAAEQAAQRASAQQFDAQTRMGGGRSDPPKQADVPSAAEPPMPAQPVRDADTGKRGSRTNAPPIALSAPDMKDPPRGDKQPGMQPDRGPAPASGDKPKGDTPAAPAQAAGASVRGAADLTQSEPAWQPESEIIATGLSPAQAADLRALGFAAAAPVSLTGAGTTVQRLHIPRGMSQEEAQLALTRQMPLTRFAPNHIYKIFNPQEGTEDLSPGGAGCGGAECFPVSLIHWQKRLGSCAAGVKIGIIDTSFDTQLPIFAKIKASHGEFLNGEAPTTSDWHGTAVLSLLAGDPQNGIPGLVPDASFYLATAFRTDEHGNASTDTVRLLAALDWLDQLGVTYVNMSFSGPRDTLVEAAIRRMHKKGVVFIAAAGNQGPTAPPSYPAAYPEVIAVTAVNKNGENYRHANRGTYIDFAAPGVDVLTSQPGGGASLRTGTSFSAPFVTAIVATRGETGTAKGAILADLRTQDLGPPGRDPIYGQGLALAPETCGPASVASASRRDGAAPLPGPRAPAAAGPATAASSTPLGSAETGGSLSSGGPLSDSGRVAPSAGPMSFGSAFAP